MMKQKTIAIFVPHYGCPCRCSFCNQNTITGVGQTVSAESAEQQIMQQLSTIDIHANRVELGFFGGSFTAIDLKLQNALLKIAKKYKDAGQIHAIRLSTRPDCIDTQTAQRLQGFGVDIVELGAQSMSDAVLSANERGHAAQDTRNACDILKQQGIAVGLQMMTGLLGDDRQTCLDTGRAIAALSPVCVRIYPTLVLKNTPLAQLYQQGQYTPQTLYDAVMLCADLHSIFRAKNIPVIRTGLLTNDGVKTDGEIVCGPYHPAFGELVQSELLYRQLRLQLHENAVVYVNPRSVSAFVGQNKENIKRFKQDGITVRFAADETVPKNQFQIQKKGDAATCV